ncbi:MAG: hypothetical protein WCV81_01450 [Microgenomates group bacterium]|jgi:hypothetical protein
MPPQDDTATPPTTGDVQQPVAPSMEDAPITTSTEEPATSADAPVMGGEEAPAATETPTDQPAA